MLKKFTIQELSIGKTSSITKRFTEQDVLMFAKVSGDFNPAHVDEDYAKTSLFKTRIVHGMLVGALFSAILGTDLPGLGSIYTFQSLKFVKPVYFNEQITATVTVKELLFDKNRVIFDCVAKNEQGDVVIIGEATIMPPN
ncbi:MAG: MaoC family dehydratase [Bacilli bacterium]